MDLGKLQDAMNDPDTATLFQKRQETLKAIETQERELGLARELLAEIEAQISEKLGLNPANGTGRKCSLCGQHGHISRNGKCPTYPNGKE